MFIGDIGELASSRHSVTWSPGQKMSASEKIGRSAATKSESFLLPRFFYFLRAILGKINYYNLYVWYRSFFKKTGQRWKFFKLHMKAIHHHAPLIHFERYM